jgi:hypothetical protein
MSVPIPDPRCYAAPNSDPFVALAAPTALDASQRAGPAHALVEAYRESLTRGDETAIAQSLTSATSPGVARALWRALDRALAVPPAQAEAPVLQVFAIPLLLVTGGKAGARIPGTVSDVQRVRDVLQGAGALGPSRNLGFGNALCAADTLRRIPFTSLHALQQGAAFDALARFDLPPADVVAATAEEEVHLRFLVGAAVTRADAPSFVETGAAIGSWGMQLTHELAGQLHVEGASVLPIPRPPASLLLAQSLGAVAREELALQAFVSRSLRRFRREVGEPDVALAALTSGALGLRFASPFVENRVDVHVRALHPTEQVGEVVAEMLALLDECGLHAVEAVPHVLDLTSFARNPAAPPLAH